MSLTVLKVCEKKFVSFQVSPQCLVQLQEFYITGWFFLMYNTTKQMVYVLFSAYTGFCYYTDSLCCVIDISATEMFFIVAGTM